MAERKINFEILRILAMIMVLGLHANFTALKSPSADTILSIDGILRTYLEAICFVAVNTFVMISGWFGIKPTLKGFFNFIWQVVYLVGILLVVGVIFFNVPNSYRTILHIIGLFGGGGWFVASYIGLYIIAPVLNAYVKHHTPKSIILMLSCFFAFEFIWGNTNSVDFINAGYSTFSFIGIYILAGLLRKIEVNKRYNCSAYFSIFIISTAINSILYIAAVNKNIRIEHIIFNYINPLIILGAASLLALFTKLRESYSVSINKTILWFSSSCFAVYLLHVGTGYALELFCDGTRAIYFSNSGLKAFILILLYMACVFIAAIIIDQPRKLIWKKALSPLFKNHV